MLFRSGEPLLVAKDTHRLLQPTQLRERMEGELVERELGIVAHVVVGVGTELITDLNAGEESWLRMIGNQFRANADHYVGDDAEFALDQFAFHPFSQLGGPAQAVRVFGNGERLAQVIGNLNGHMFGGAPDDDAERGTRPASTPPLARH